MAFRSRSFGAMGGPRSRSDRMQRPVQSFEFAPAVDVRAVSQAKRDGDVHTRRLSCGGATVRKHVATQTVGLLLEVLREI